MKKNIFLLVLTLLTFSVYAKKVKFACDMTGQVINPNGIHVSGDFQTLAGFPGGDWASNTTPITLEDSITNIYSIVVDIPAFAKYEYKFVNGDMFYDAEFVPEPSRVGYNFNDNRWIYVDSLADDTTFVGAIRYAQNAPAGLTLIRFKVDMQAVIVNASGMHVAGDFQNWDPATTILYSFGSGVYEIISYVTSGTYEYKFYNGNIAGTEEVVPLACQVNTNREVVVQSDTVLAAVCFGSCTTCVGALVQFIGSNYTVMVFPNPSADVVYLTFGEKPEMYQVQLYDNNGRLIRYYGYQLGSVFKIEKGSLLSGTYFATIEDAQHHVSTKKLIFE